VIDALTGRATEATGTTTPGPLQVSVAEGYERWAATYDCGANPLLALEERCIEGRIPDLTGKFVLDLACGTGRWFERLSHKGAQRIVGSDSSAAMLLVAAKRNANAATLIRADACRLPHPEARFDFALCSFAIGHIWAMDLFASECGRVLRPRCELFVTDLHPQAYAAGWRTGFRDGETAVEIPSLPRSSVELVDTFLSAGFECEEAASFPFGQPEEVIFRRAGKFAFFESACRGPAICLYRFRRSKKALQWGKADRVF